jgi:simple sugar transport system ATP-binding protein
MLAVQMTRGLDVGAIEYIHSQILKQREEGKAILMISLELEEILKLSDRIIVMYEGKIVAELNPKQTTKEMIGLYMAGGKPS